MPLMPTETQITNHTDGIRKLQEIECNILKKIIWICKEENIRYFALDGTLLGAIRHKGMIPWDDDIDIGMPRKDYEKFIYVAEKKLGKEYALMTDKNEEVYTLKVVAKNTQVILHMAGKPIKANVWVDIFPIDGMPETSIVRNFHKLQLLFARMMVQAPVVRKQVHLKREKRPIYEKILLFLFLKTNLGKNIDIYKWKKRVEKILKKYDYDESKYIVDFWSAYKFREMFPKEIYGDGRLCEFEDFSVMVPVYAEAVLKQLYGYYLTPPDEDKKYNQHKIEIVKL